jgi:hypothetical protein
VCGGAHAGGAHADARTLELARDGRTSYTIVLAASASPAEELATSELARYLKQMSGATFPVATSSRTTKAIVVRVQSAPHAAPLPTSARNLVADDSYSIAVRGDTLYLTGATGRAVLYAAYDLLERLGCRWLAPAFFFYEVHAENVPRIPTLFYASARDVRERPAMAFRKLVVEEGLSHDEQSLRRLVEWMPKARYNVLQLPANFGGSGRVSWDNWRAALTPELDRRGLLIEVGGHGYQNYLNAEMENGELFVRHPEWFGKDSSCAPSKATKHVFNTANADAVRYVIGNVVAYLGTHPEIAIFDFWPPDGARWADCAADKSLGTVSDRQASLVNTLHAALAKAAPNVRLEMIAYSEALAPPRAVVLHPDVLVDFCPINQSFDAQISDPRSVRNAAYAAAIRDWRSTFTGDVALYSYYRKYAWRSLPVIIPRYVQRDVQWYADVPLQGISTYSEPGDWGTYELNHYALGKVAWNPRADMRRTIDSFVVARYGRQSSGVARAALAALESTTRVYGGIPFSTRHTSRKIAKARTTLLAHSKAVRAAYDAIVKPLEAAGPDLERRSTAEEMALSRLFIMLEFEQRDLAIMQARAEQKPAEAIRPMVEELVKFLGTTRHRGTFLVREGDLARYLKMYGVAT